MQHLKGSGTPVLYIGRRVLKRLNIQCKGKAIPLQAWTGPEGSRRLKLPYFKIIGT